MTAAQSERTEPVTLEMMIAEAAAWQDAHLRWPESSVMNIAAIDAILSLLQAIKSPSDAFLLRLCEAAQSDYIDCDSMRNALAALVAPQAERGER